MDFELDKPRLGFAAVRSRMQRVPSFAVRSTTNFVARRRLAQRWPELSHLLITDRVPDGGETERRDAVRAAVPQPNERISVLLPSKRPRMIDNIVSNISRQTLAPVEVVLVFDETTHSPDDVAVLDRRLGAVPLVPIESDPNTSLGQRLNDAIDASSSDWLARMDDDDWYGADFLADSIRAALVSQATMVGKATYPVVWTASQKARLRFPGLDYRFVSAVAGATMMWNRHRVTVEFPNTSIGEDGAAQRRLLRRGGTVFSSDPFQFVVQRQADATWDDREGRLDASGPAISAVQAYHDGGPSGPAD